MLKGFTIRNGVLAVAMSAGLLLSGCAVYVDDNQPAVASGVTVAAVGVGVGATPVVTHKHYYKKHYHKKHYHNKHYYSKKRYHKPAKVYTKTTTTRVYKKN